MKKLLSLAIFISLLMIFSACSNGKPPEIIPEENKSSLSSSKTAEEEPKIFLPLINFLEEGGLDLDSAEGIEITGKRTDIPFAVPEGVDEYNHSAIKTDIPPELEEALKEDYPDFCKDCWKAVLSYYTSDFSAGMIKANYVIGDKIVTNKAIVCTIENGKITRINYTNMDMNISADHEAELLEKVKIFEKTTTQTKKVFEEGEEFLSEDIQYNYYYNLDALVYTYQLFFYMDTGSGKVINNSYGCEYIIE